jgi:pimeloyl-ACP methyl ester carboxylesterase
MSLQPTPIFIPGLICTADLFAAQIRDLQHPVAPKIANTLECDSITGMARDALALAEGRLVPVGLSMGGYVALEMARIAPDRMAGIALLNTGFRTDDAARSSQRLAAIEMAKSEKFRGVTRHLLGTFLSPAALADEALVARVIKMADDVGRKNFLTQQKAIMGRRDQSRTLRNLGVRALVLCGKQDTLTPPEISQEMAALAPQSDLVLLDEVGHLSTLEAADAVTAALDAYLASI